MNNFCQLYVMLVFGVKYRLGLIAPEWRDQLYNVLGRIAKTCGCVPLEIGGYKDHVHVLISTTGSESLENIVRKLKSDSSRWVNGHKLTQGRFGWQRGSGRISYAYSQLDDVRKYIANQQIHHANFSFREEWEYFIKKYGHMPNDFDLPEPLE